MESLHAAHIVSGEWRMESELLGLHHARGERSHQADLKDLKDLQDPVESLSFQSPQTSGRLQGA